MSDNAMTRPETELICVNGHDRCNEGPFEGCPYCERRAAPTAPSDVVREWEDGRANRWTPDDPHAAILGMSLCGDRMAAALVAQAKTIEGLEREDERLHDVLANLEEGTEQYRALAQAAEATVTELRTANSQLVVRYEFALSEQKAAESALETARGALEASRISHNSCEDTWYACPKSEGGCADDRYAKDECNCGADSHNAAIDKALAALPSPPITTGKKA